MIRNIIFDIGGVLVRLRKDEWLFEDLKLSEEEAKLLDRSMFGSPLWKEVDRGLIPYREVIKRLCEETPEAAELLKKGFAAVGGTVEKTDYAIPWICSLKEAGYRVYYLSNYFEELRRQNREALSFLSYMDGGVWSDEEKLIKPDHRIFERLCEKYGLVPEECIFLDDTAVNLVAAEECRFSALLVEDPGDAMTKLKKSLKKEERITILP